MAARTKAVPVEPVVPAGPVKWTKALEKTFLEHLALSSNVAASERAALIPPGAAYRQRERSAAFRRAWEVALKDGYDRLELAMLERAINGIVIEITDARGRTTKKIEYSEGVAMTLLKAHRASVAEITGRQDGDGARATLERKLATMARRLGHEG